MYNSCDGRRLGMEPTLTADNEERHLNANARSVVSKVIGTDSLAEVVESKASLDRVFEFVARELPTLALEISEIVRSLRVEGDQQPPERIQDLTAVRAALAHELHGAERWICDSQREVDEILTGLRPGVAQLRRALSEVRNGALKLRILAMNASLVARRSGHQMNGFAVTTIELTRIAAEQLRESAQVIDIIDDVTQQFGQLEAIGQSLLQQTECIAITRTDASLDGVMLTHANIKTILRDIEERYHAVASGIGRTMIAIQRQDILRQGLDHVALIARELVNCETTLREADAIPTNLSERLIAAEVQRRGGLLCADLLAEIQRETLQFLDEIESHVVNLRDLTGILNQVTSNAISSELQSQVSAIRTASLELERSLASSARARECEATLISALSGTVSKLPARLRMFAERQEQVRTLGMLIRRQNARYYETAEAKAVGQELDDLLRNSATAWSTLEDAGEFRTRMRALARRTSEDADPWDSRISHCLGDVEMAARALSGHAEDMMSKARRSVSATGSVTTHILEAIAALKSDLSGYTTIIGRFRTSAERAAQVLKQFGGEADSELELPKRLRDVIDQFTIFSHKQLARNTNGSEPSNSEDAGSITLF